MACRYNNPFHMFSKYIMIVTISGGSEMNGEYENIISLEGLEASWHKVCILLYNIFVSKYSNKIIIKYYFFKISKLFNTHGDEYFFTVHHFLVDLTEYRLDNGFPYDFKLSSTVIKMILPIKFKST